MDPSEPPAGRRETLQGGPERAPLLDRLPPEWRRRSVVLLALVLGVSAGVGATWWSPDRPPAGPPAEPSPVVVRAARYDVRLILTDLVASTADGRGDDSLRVDAVLLHSLGPGTATVTRIHRAGGSLVVRVAALPVALSGNHPIERVRLRITPLDCGLAAGWTPSAQPFTVTWRDEDGRVRTDPGGDHDASMSLALVRWVDRACGDPGEDEQS